MKSAVGTRPPASMKKVVKNSVKKATKKSSGTIQEEKEIKNDDGSKGGVCSRKPTQDYHSIPRKIQVDVCKTDEHRQCEKFSNIFQFPVKEQDCHSEPKKIYEVETKTRPKKAKK